MILVKAGMGNKYSTFRVRYCFIIYITYGIVLTAKYGTDDLNLNKYTHNININYAKVSV